MKSDYVDIHCHVQRRRLCVVNTSADCLCGDMDKSKLFSVGVHPMCCSTTDMEYSLSLVKEKSACENVVAIGEIGLDKCVDIDYELQKIFFKNQLKMAQIVSKPAVIHNVRALADILQIYKSGKFTVPLIFHGFKGKPQTVLQICSIGGFVSFDPNIITDRSWDKAVCCACENNILFFETDDKNIDIELVYRAAASVTGVDVDLLKEEIFNRFIKLFNLYGLV